MNKYREPIPLQEAMKTDPELREVVDKLMKGELHLCSPFPGMDKPWTEEEKKGLADALAQFGWK